MTSMISNFSMISIHWSLISIYYSLSFCFLVRLLRLCFSSLILKGHCHGLRILSVITLITFCLLRNAVYQITCNNCNQHYIGSTIRFIHDRVREHLNNDNSSVKKHLSQCQNKVYKGIEIKSIVLENDPANLRLLEAFYIRKYKPTMNSREECSEFADLLF